MVKQKSPAGTCSAEDFPLKGYRWAVRLITLALIIRVVVGAKLYLLEDVS